MQPINYLQGFTDPFTSVAKGYTLGAGIRDDQQQQAQLEQQRQQQMQMQADVRSVLSNPNTTPTELTALGVRYPALAAGVKVMAENLSAEQKKAAIGDMLPLYAALSSNSPDVAKKLLTDRATALRNSGMEDRAKQAEAMANVVETSPGIARNLIGLQLSQLDEKFAENAGKLGGEQRAQQMFPAELATKEAGATKAQADARIATTEADLKAKYGEQTALLDLQKKGWDITKIQEDIKISKEANRIAAMNAATAAATNDLRRQELQLKVQEQQQKIDTQIREKTAEFDSIVSGFTDARTLISEIKSLRDEALVNPTGLTAGAALMPGSNARTQAGKIEQLQNTLAAANLEKLKGPTSDKDIAFIKNISSNLDKWQSDSRFAAELEKIDGALVRLDAAARKKYGAPPAPTVSNPAPSAAKPLEAKAGVTVSNW